MACLVIEPVDASFVRIRSSDRGALYELSSYFTFKVPGHFYMPAFRNGTWDGTIRLFNSRDQTLPRGLLARLLLFCADRGYDHDMSLVESAEPKTEPMTVEQADEYIRSLKPTFKGQPLVPHRHQAEALSMAMSDRRSVLLSPTSSGKSLVIYAWARYHADNGRAVLVIVPNIGLVGQMAEDFIEYSSKSGWADKNCQIIMEGESKDVERPVVISTWQSIYKMPASWFEQFEAIVGDEAHHFKAKSLGEIMGKCKTIHHRLAMTGTLDGTEVHRLTIEGHFGPVRTVTTTKELMEKDIVSLLRIHGILLQHPPKNVSAAREMSYAEEMRFLCEMDSRNKFIAMLVSMLEGNTLVLFQFIAHGKALVEAIQKACPGRTVRLVYGDVDSAERMDARAEMEDSDNAVIVASYPTFSTGISIRKLHNVVFASPFKSGIRLRQSIGRQLRKHPTKKKALLFDIGDSLVRDPTKSRANTTLKHFQARLAAYRDENFEHVVRKVNLQ